MNLGNLKPPAGQQKTQKRVGRGMGSHRGKTSGRGHKGKGARSGGNTPPGYEGGQMPLQRRLPKRGFASLTQRFNAEVRLYQLQVMKADVVDLETLKNEGLVGHGVRSVKVINTGNIERPITISGLKVSAGAKAAIEAAGGKVE